MRVFLNFTLRVSISTRILCFNPIQFSDSRIKNPLEPRKKPFLRSSFSFLGTFPAKHQFRPRTICRPCGNRVRSDLFLRIVLPLSRTFLSPPLSSSLSLFLDYCAGEFLHWGDAVVTSSLKEHGVAISGDPPLLFQKDPFSLLPLLFFVTYCTELRPFLFHMPKCGVFIPLEREMLYP